MGTGTANERLAGFVFGCTRRFADQHDPALESTCPGHRVAAMLVQRAAPAGSDAACQAFQHITIFGFHHYLRWQRMRLPMA
jgi:hypothetical protein